MFQYIPCILDDFANNQQIFSLSEKSKLKCDRKLYEPFYQAKLSTSEIVSFPKETSELSKAIVMFHRASNPA